MMAARCYQRRLLLLVFASLLFIALILSGVISFCDNLRRNDEVHVAKLTGPYSNAVARIRLQYKRSSVLDHTTIKLTLEEQCVKEVLELLDLPFHLHYYLLTQPLPRNLALDRLSSACRIYLTPKRVTASRRRKLACFLPQPWFDSFGPNEKSRIDGALHLIVRTFQQAGLPIYLDGGSALGSWRMHGLIPYDSDIDLMIFDYHEEPARVLCQKLMATFPGLIKFYEHGYHFWRLDILRPNTTRLFQIDLFIFHHNEKEQISEFVLDPFKVNTSNLLPFVLRPFQGILVLSWRNLPDFNRQVYGAKVNHLCKPATWIPYFYKIKCPRRLVKCDELNYFFNFVKRWFHPDGRLVEVLFNRSHVLGVFHAPES